MARPPDIPSGIWDAAEAVGELIPEGPGAAVTVTIGDIARAIMAERMAERAKCLAAIEAVRVSPEWSGLHADWVCGAITEAINGEAAIRGQVG